MCLRLLFVSKAKVTQRPRATLKWDHLLNHLNRVILLESLSVHTFYYLLTVKSIMNRCMIKSLLSYSKHLPLFEIRSYQLVIICVTIADDIQFFSLFLIRNWFLFPSLESFNSRIWRDPDGGYVRIQISGWVLYGRLSSYQNWSSQNSSTLSECSWRSFCAISEWV